MGTAGENELRAIARAIDGVVYTPSSSIAGRVGGHAVTYRLTTRGVGSNATEMTEVEALVEASSIQLELRPQDSHEERLVKKGVALDLTLDDEPFDRAFIVEGAPTGAIKRWLVAEVREQLVRFAPITVELRGKLLVLAKERWIVRPHEARDLAECAARLATEHARVVHARRDDALASASAQRDGYRDALSPDAARKAIEHAERTDRAELAKLRDVREARDARARAMAFGLIVLFAVGLAVAVYFMR
jgi:hypothetical protein